MWIEVVICDNTTEALGVIQTTQNSDLLAAGTALTTAGTGTWTSGDTEDYIITKALGAIAAAPNSNIEVWACLGKYRISANFDQSTLEAT